MEWVRWIKAGGVSFGGGSDVFEAGTPHSKFDCGVPSGQSASLKSIKRMGFRLGKSRSSLPFVQHDEGADPL
jgi:hypothetical protein